MHHIRRKGKGSHDGNVPAGGSAADSVCRRRVRGLGWTRIDRFFTAGLQNVRTPQAEIEDLISRVAMGDRAAFRALYERTAAKLFGVCLRVLDDRTLAEEALQDVYMKVWHRAGQYRVNGFSPMTWLITLTRNAAVDRRRRRDAGGRAKVQPIEAADLVADPGPGPAAQAEARAEARVLAACMAELPPDRAEMVRRAYLEGATYAEISAACGVKLNTVRTWLRRSLMTLRECLSR